MSNIVEAFGLWRIILMMSIVLILILFAGWSFSSGTYVNYYHKYYRKDSFFNPKYKYFRIVLTCKSRFSYVDFNSYTSIKYDISHLKKFKKSIRGIRKGTLEKEIGFEQRGVTIGAFWITQNLLLKEDTKIKIIKIK